MAEETKKPQVPKLIDEKKAITWGASIPTGGGWENLPLTERVRGTFERGVVRAEMDLGDAYKKGIQPGHVPERQRRIAREVAAEFGSQFSVHFPYQVEMSSPNPFVQADAAELLRQTIDYAKGMGAKMITIHPTTTMGAAFRDPITTAYQQVPAHYLLRDQPEFDQWCSYNRIPINGTLYDKFKQEWQNFVRAQSSVFARDYAAAAPIFKKDFGNVSAKYGAMQAVDNEMRKGVSDPNVLKAVVEAEILKRMGGGDEDIKKGAMMIESQFRSNPDGFVREMIQASEGARQNNEDLQKELNDTIKYYWSQVAIATGGAIDKEGRYHAGKEKLDIFREAITADRLIDLPGDENKFIDNLRQTFDKAFSDPKVRDDIIKNKLKLNIENVWGMNPETGFTQGFAYYYKPEHIKKAIDAMREAARKHGIPEDAIGLVFDTEHSAIGQNPEEFVDRLKELGVKIDHVHLVGGSKSASHPIFGHKGFGSVEDEIMAAHPKLLEKMIEAGVPITIEPGSGGPKDIEDALRTMQTGAPEEAMLGASAGEKGLRFAGYTGEPSYYQEQYQMNSSFVQKAGFYSFGPNMPQPFRTTYNPIASPAIYQGGMLMREPATTLWPSTQPLQYGPRRPEGEEG